MIYQQPPRTDDDGPERFEPWPLEPSRRMRLAAIVGAALAVVVIVAVLLVI